MNEQSTMMNKQQQQQQQQKQNQFMNLNPNLMSMSQLNPHQQPPPPQMPPMNRSYGAWVPPPQFQNPNLNPIKPPPPQFGSSVKPPSASFNKALGPRSNWKGKKKNDKRRKDQQLMVGPSTGGIGVGGAIPNFNSYQPPTLNDLQHQNRMKTRRFFPKKNFNKNNNMNMNMNMGSYNNNQKYGSRSAPYAPRNTTSFLIRAKKSGGIAPLVSPCPVTPSVLPTPVLSPSREVLGDMAKEEWGVDGYGSMKGLIRLRSPGNEVEPPEDEDEDEGGSSDSDVEEHVEVERRLDHDLSRFEMIYDPNSAGGGGMEYHNVLENRVDDQDSHIAQLEEENLILKERLFLMERELGDLRRRMQSLERKRNVGEENHEEVVENESENDSESRGEEAHSMEDNNEDFGDDNVREGDRYSKGISCDGISVEDFEAGVTSENKSVSDNEGKVENNDTVVVETDNDVVNTTVAEENNGDKFTEANKSGVEIVVDEDKVKNDNENNMVDADSKAGDNIDIKSSEHVKGEGDVSMKDVGVLEDNVAN